MKATQTPSLEAFEALLDGADAQTRAVLGSFFRALPGLLAATRDSAERRATAALATEAEQRRSLEQRVAALEAQLASGDPNA